jgi:hypothetical protein
METVTRSCTSRLISALLWCVVDIILVSGIAAALLRSVVAVILVSGIAAALLRAVRDVVFDRSVNGPWCPGKCQQSEREYIIRLLSLFHRGSSHCRNCGGKDKEGVELHGEVYRWRRPDE